MGEIMKILLLLALVLTISCDKQPPPMCKNAHDRSIYPNGEYGDCLYAVAHMGLSYDDPTDKVEKHNCFKRHYLKIEVKND